MFNFNNTYNNLPSIFYQKTHPETPLNPQLIAFNEDLAREIGIEKVDLKELNQVLSGAKIPNNTEPIALAYAGHQFGHFVPELGDGRAVLLGELLNKNGERFDLQLKGSGKTRYSRRGDGKSPLGPVIREYIVSEAMHALGVPTTRALAAIRTDETIIRQQTEPGGVFARVAASHIRIGTFVYFAAKQDHENLKILTDYAIKRHYPDCAQKDQPYLEFFKSVCERQLDLVSSWMSFGFIHGVMNTDNTTISGQTIDYGPCAFMDHFEFNKVYSSIDRNSRYAYNQQGSIIIWNLARLAECLIPIIDNDEKVSIKKLTTILESLPARFKDLWQQKLLKKFGLLKSDTNSSALINLWLEYLQSEKLDFTNSFRNLNKIVQNIDHGFKATEKFNHFLYQYQESFSSIDTNDLLNTMNSANPIYIPRNHQVQKAISNAIDGDYKYFHTLTQLLKKPFEHQEKMEAFIKPPLENEIVTATFCGT